MGKNKRKRKINYDLVIQNRVLIFLVIIVSLFGIIIFKMVDVMLFNKKIYTDNLERLSYTKVTGTSSPRGRIYDRNYNIIVDNKSLKTIVYQKKKGTTNLEMIEVARKISSHLDLNYSRLTERARREYYFAKNKGECDKLVTKSEIEKVKQRKLTQNELDELKLKRISEEKLKFSPEEERIAYIYYLMNKGYTYEEKIIKSDASDVEYAYVSENNEELVGFNTKIDWERVYPYGDTLRSILGTVSTPSQGIPAEEKDYYLEKGYSLNDRVGLSYLEKEYEEYLKGEKALYEVVNSHETKLIKEGSRGKDIVLSIDINLQKEVERILEENIRRAKGEANTDYYDHSSVIIQEPNTGEILAIASKRIVGDNVIDNTTSILMSPITPGSVVKGASMLVGYNEGAVHIGERMLDECVKVAGTPEKCSSVNNLGVIDDITALAKSSNVYQFKIAIRVNGQEYFRGMRLNFNQEAFDKYRNMYHSFGLGVKTEIDLPVESSGYSSKDKAAGNLLDFVMGQYETYTPIQLSQYISTIANGGERVAPHLLKEVHKSSDNDKIGDVDFNVERKVLNKIDTSEEYLNRVKQGFIAVLNSPGGYGVGYMDTSMRPAGKTGTSQSFIDTNNDGRIDTETITSSFIGYAPYDNPKMSIVVTSPDSSHPNSSTNYASLVTYRITREVTAKYTEMYGID
ncbi:MAG: penicillin-binding protein 2 [Bacilli bacterium]|nr:penicillin-binding protein 2 [Bacilli bacterium]